MQPRTFPKEKKFLGSVKTPTGSIPRPALPGLSIVVDKSDKTQLAKVVRPKKSFIKWKQQHEALFEPKQFRTTIQTIAVANQRKELSARLSGTRSIPNQSTSEVGSNFNLSVRELDPRQRDGHDECQQCDGGQSKQNFRSISGKRPEFQSMMAFSQLNRMARSEAAKQQQQYSNPIESIHSNSCGCQCVAVATRGEEVGLGEETESNLQLVESSKDVVVKPAQPLNKKMVASIIEEQIEIVEQQKQILLQQNEIFKLQYRIEKLMLMNNGPPPIPATANNRSSPIRKSIEGPPSPTPGENGLHGNTKVICSPDRNRNLMTPPENGSPEDTMLEHINKIIENSPPMMNYKANGNRGSPIRADINFSAQTLIYKSSTRNIPSDSNVPDRSFALHLLDMKYRPESPSPPPNANHFAPRSNAVADKTRRSSASSKATNTDNDFVPSNISPDKYDYLIRHGLVKK